MEQILIQIPEGHVIDTEQSNLEEGKIVFKKKEVTPWRFTNPKIQGFFVARGTSEIIKTFKACPWLGGNESVFATERQARSMRAMAQLSQIIQNDERFGGPITDEEWCNNRIMKYLIDREKGRIVPEDYQFCAFRFLAFHTEKQRDLFLKENEDLIRQYYMLD